MRLEAIRRYPVKAMAGESLATVEVETRGLVGDRAYAVVDDDGRLAAGKDSRRFRRREQVFDYAARTDGDDAVVVARGEWGWAVGDPALDADLAARMGAPVRVRPEGPVPYFDAAPVSLVGTATLAAVAADTGLPADQRRFRVNLLVATETPYVEEGWSAVRIGAVELTLTERVERCRVVDLAQDGAAAAPGLLRALAGERDLCVAVYAEVRRPGTLRVGDDVEVLA